jgi:hypothetical protein
MSPLPEHPPFATSKEHRANMFSKQVPITLGANDIVEVGVIIGDW